MRRLVRFVPLFAVAGLAMCRDAPQESRAVTAPTARLDEGSGAGDGQDEQEFRVDFAPLNNSGVKAHAELRFKDGNLVVHIEGVGELPNQIHPQHIHGFTTKAASCPTAANDTNGDGVITFAEGLPSFGPVQVDLQPYPTPTNPAGQMRYRRTFVASQVPFPAADLTQKVMVLHGDFFGSGYVASLPVACGPVVPED